MNEAQRITEWVEQKKESAIALARAVWGFAEPNWRETQSAAAISAALEGGINYWCRRVVVQGKYLGEYASDQISRGGQLAVWLEEPFEDDKTCYMLDLDKFLAGFKQWLENCYANCDVVDSTDGSVDCGQIDATCADEIVQHALFGDLVFG